MIELINSSVVVHQWHKQQQWQSWTMLRLDRSGRIASSQNRSGGAPRQLTSHGNHHWLFHTGDRFDDVDVSCMHAWPSESSSATVLDRLLPRWCPVVTLTSARVRIWASCDEPFRVAANTYRWSHACRKGCVRTR
jgi:hypothetical protein